MIGHVGDFGLARFLHEEPTDSSTNQSSSIGLRGTIGYAPPDPILLWQREDGGTRTDDTQSQNRTSRPEIQECLILIFGIGVSCSMEFPRERMIISDVVAQLHLIREKLFRTRRRRERLQFTGTEGQ
ncbi:hypothetical protein ACJW30_11G129900 [Castanea mollissima]